MTCFEFSINLQETVMVAKI